MRVVVTATAAAALLAVLAAPAGARVGAQAPGTWCGGTLWRLMTLSDTGRKSVNWTPATTSIPDVGKLAAPARVTATRSTTFQKQRWQVTAVIERYRIASNGEVVFELFDIASGMYMNAYMPNPSCLSSSTRGRSSMLAARSAFLEACPAPQKTWGLLGATATLSGVGFWNPVKTTPGALRNGAELRPVTSFQLVNGCGKG
jgi:hypothetical protein